jgi:hypothetical protein
VSPIVPGDSSALLRELKELQTSLFDKATAYTKLILGLGYAAFFTVWAGTHQRFSVRQAMISALFMMVSLVLYIIFEIAQTTVISYLGIDFARAVSAPSANIEASLREYNERSAKLTRPLMAAWKIIFPLTVISGLCGAVVLISAFVVSLWRMK